ncbi:sugar ABC transporter ATP-binding protein [Aminithiophilus ramosus]|uniref:Sugar ABC transporter ATP-binding protein n=2 Tax=Synergistales TaxID=649776 RepID=A0A9Q7AEC6_9BACT|nr:sugar ABC transporter ATP-binding protein [Aminithiophilus ramosus]QTX31774.1 sugar ABC transporter ATP-binding protein [Aminithiophilus ramosus]QVL35596.1 sugar ABC transporter ATP-binding protein [Synergistota bacterium]
MTGIPLLQMNHVGKDFFGNRVLSDVSFSLDPGQILGLVGENGAGKSTLMKIIFGMPDIHETGGFDGDVLFNGSKIHFSNPFDALEAGIGMVHQEFSLIPGFTAAENILLNRESFKSNPMVNFFGERISTLDRPSMRARALRAIETLGVDLDPETLTSEMPVGHKQFTEIARELDRTQMKLLILDEPTAVLTETEAQILLSALKKLASRGISIIFISHRLQEVIDLCDKVVVLRDGQIIQDVPACGVSVRQIAQWMVGRKVEDPSDRRSVKRNLGDPVLEVEHLWVDMPGETVRDVSFCVHKGEIFGIGGLAGQGKLGIPNGIMGLFTSGGTVSLKGNKVRLNDPKLALASGMAFVSEDRRGVGLLLQEPIDWNIAFTAMQVHGRYVKGFLGGWVQWRDDAAIKACAEEYIDSLQIRCTGSRQRAIELSGGNQQKVCLAKAFCVDPEILFVSEPTRGIDVGAKRLVLDTLRRVNEEQGTTIIMTSSELEELRSICDRIAIVSEGKIEGILSPSAPAEEFGLLMSGSGKNAEEKVIPCA